VQAAAARRLSARLRGHSTSQVLGQDPGELFDVLPAPLTDTHPVLSGSAPTPAAGSTPRSREEVHREGLWHRSVHLWIVDRHGEVLLQQHRHKDTWPLHWDVSCAGHVKAGDDIGVPALPTAVRELQEELGIDHAANDLDYLFTYVSSENEWTKALGTWQNNEYQDVFLLRLEAAHADVGYVTDASGERLRWETPVGVRYALHCANPGDNRPSSIGGLFVPRSAPYYDPLFRAISQDLPKMPGISNRPRPATPQGGFSIRVDKS
jgi:isopentenyldiphosphate isomerase